MNVNNNKKSKKIKVQNSKIFYSKTSPYQIPPNLTNLLKEHSVGYILLSVDYNGQIAFNSNADNEIVMRGLMEKLNDIYSLYIDSVRSEMIRNVQDDSSNDDENEL